MVMAVVSAGYSLYYTLEPQVSTSIEEAMEQHISDEKGDKPTSQQNTKTQGEGALSQAIFPCRVSEEGVTGDLPEIPLTLLPLCKGKAHFGICLSSLY